MTRPLPREVAEEAVAILVALKRTVPAHLYCDHDIQRAEGAAVDRMPHALL